MDAKSTSLKQPNDGIKKYVLSDVSSCTFTFNDGGKSNVHTPHGKEMVIVKFIPTVNEDKILQDSVIQNYLYSKNVQELTERCGYDCVKTFTRHFKKCFKKTPYQWMLDRKMEDIRFLVLNSTLTISKISEIYDFRNVSHLVSAYSAKFGISPNKNRALLSAEVSD